MNMEIVLERADNSGGKKHPKEVIDRNVYPLSQAIERSRESARAKFIESCDVVIVLSPQKKAKGQGVQEMRVISHLPHGTGKKVSILAFVPSAMIGDCIIAGAEMAGLEDMIEKIEAGNIDLSKIDTCVAHISVIPQLAKIAKILGPKGLMPGPKSGTSGTDVVQIIKTLRAGQVSLRVDKTGVIHAKVGNLGFSADKLVDNVRAFVRDVIAAKPANVPSSHFIKRIAINSTMGPAFTVDVSTCK